MCTKNSNASIFEEVKRNGFISEKQINLLKRRSNAAGRDLFNYDLIEECSDGYGVPCTEEQGAKGLKWLRSFVSKKDAFTSIKGAAFGYREFEIIRDATAKDFRFVGFYDAGNGWLKNYVPMYEVLGMEYVALSTPYIIG